MTQSSDEWHKEWRVKLGCRKCHKDFIRPLGELRYVCEDCSIKAVTSGSSQRDMT